MKKPFLLGAVFITIYMFLSLAFVYAADEKKEKNSKITTSYEIGEKFTEVFGYEVSDISDDIKYQRSSISLDQKLSPRLSYIISQLVESRKYDSNSNKIFDNRFTRTLLSGSYKLLKSECFLTPQEIRTSYMYKHKDYFHGSNVNNNDYVQNKFGLGISYIGDKENWRIDYDTGINSFDYSIRSINDENKIFNQIQVKKKFLQDKFTVFAGYKIQFADRKNGDDRTEPEKTVGFDFKPGLKNLSLVSFRFENGKSETREEEFREDLRDYSYERFITKAETPITAKFKNSFTHRLIWRKYNNFNKSYHIVWMENTSTYTQIDDKVKALYYELGLEYKQPNFTVSSTSNYIARQGSIAMTFDRKKNWKIKQKFAFRIQKFDDKHILDARRYIYNLSLEKTISPDSYLSFDLRREWRDYYRGTPDKTYESYCMSLNYKF